MKKFWMILLAVVLVFGLVVGCGKERTPENDDDFDVNLPDIVINAADIALVKIGSGTGSGASSVTANKFIIAYTGTDDATGAGFGYEFPASSVVDRSIYKYVRLEATITEIDGNSTAAFTVKRNPQMDDLAGFGSNSNPQHSRNAELNLGGNVGDSAIITDMRRDEIDDDKILLRLFNGDGIYFQFNPWNEFWKTGKNPPTTWEDATNHANLKGAQNFTIEVTKITFTNGGIVDPGSHVPVTTINEMPTKSVPHLLITLPERAASPATNRDIVWSLKSAGGTGATLDGRVLKTVTSKGTITVTATVTNGLTATTNFVRDYDIVIDDPNGIFLTDFSAQATGSQLQGGAGYDAATNTWTFNGSWGGVQFDIGSMLSSTNFDYDAVTVVFAVEAVDENPKDNDTTRFTFNRSGSNLFRTLAGDWTGGYEGWYDLDPVKDADGKHTTDINQVRIAIPDVGEYDRFLIENKGVAGTKITIHAVYFEKKEKCEFCEGTMPTHAAGCFIPVTSITRAPTTNYVNLGLTLPAKAWPSYATNRDITWSGTGVSSNIFTPTAAGEVTITGTVTNGLTAASDFVREFKVVVTPATEVVLLPQDITTRAFGWGATVKAPGTIEINSNYSRFGANIGTSIYNDLYGEAVLVLKAPQNGRFGLFINGGLIGHDSTSGDTAGWESFQAGDAETVTIDLSKAIYNDLAITQFVIENVSGTSGDFEVESITFKLKE